MKGWKQYVLDVNGFTVVADYNDETVENIFKPMLMDITKMQREKGERVIVFLAAPPAVGKTTLAQFLQHLSKGSKEIGNIQAIGLDGFHYNAEYIKSHMVIKDGKEVAMQKVKGSPETFDLNKIKKKLSEIKGNNILWPIYDRRVHDVVEDIIEINGDIIILEGNWLLLNEAGWNELKEFCDLSIMIKAPEDMLKKRLIDRKVKGGLSEKAAKDFYENSDKLNIKRVLENSLDSDIIIDVTFENDYILR